MKKLKFILIAALLLSLSACGNTADAGGGNELYVYNWGDYIDPDVLELFKEETGINVNYDTYPTNEEMYSKLKGGGAFYDVAFPSDYMIEKMINEDMLESIDMAKVPNFSNVDGLFKNLFFDPNNEYSVAYMWGTVGILYNKTKVTEPVDSWDILWDEKYAKQIFMYDSVRDSIGITLRRLGYSINTKVDSELEEAKQALIDQYPLVQAYLGDQVKDAMVGGQGALAVVYSGDAMACMELNPDLAYVVPNEGSNYWYDGMVIPKGAKNKANAEIFIDFMCRPDIAAKNSEYIGYSTSNKEALSLMDQETINDPTYWPSQEILEKCELFYDLGDYTQKYYDIWTEILVR